MADYRMDGIINALTSLGTASDKHTYNRTSRPRLFTEQELDWMYESGRFASTIIDRIPDDCTRKPFEVTTKTNAGILFEEEFKRLQVADRFNTADKWGRLLGGAGILMVVEDGLPLHAPMDLSRVNDVIALHTFDYSELYVREWYTDVRHPQYGEHKIYNLTPSLSPGVSEVHASRILPFYGRKIRRYRIDRYDYWGQPELERIWQCVSDIETATGALATGMHNAAFFKLKLKNLKDLLTGPDIDNLDSSRFIQRLQAIRMSKSIINALAIDADLEDIEPVSMDLKGLIDGYGVFQQNLAFITGIPMSLLFGIHPSGFSNNDETGLENYRQTIASNQNRQYLPNLKKLLEVLNAAKIGPTGGELIPDLMPQFKPLDEIKPSQRVELESKMAETATKLIDKGVITSEDERKRLSQAAFTERWILQDEDADKVRQQEIERYRRRRTKAAEIEDTEGNLGLLRNGKPTTARGSSEAYGFDRADKSSKRQYTIPGGAAANAKKVNRWLRQKEGFKGGTASGKARMRQLASGGKISLSDLVEINAWFARHRGNEAVSAEYKDEPWRDAGYTSFLMWGGDTMRSYAKSIVEANQDAPLSPRKDATSGAMIAIMAPTELEEAAHPYRASDYADSLHCTLIYMPSLMAGDIERVKEVMRFIASQNEPIDMSINGAGMFSNSNKWVHVLNPSGMGLNQLRADLCTALSSSGLLGEQTYDFIPHMTLGYYESGNIPGMYAKSLANQWPEWVASRICLVAGDELIYSVELSS